MEFEWDDAKAEANTAKHGIDFAAARKVFDDPDLALVPDDRYAETRFKAIGLIGGIIVVVGFTMRGDICRIITARRANRRERQKHYPL